MAASILSSPRAVEMTIYVLRAFVRLRRVLASHVELARELDELTRPVSLPPFAQLPLLAPAKPKNTTTARFNRTRSSSSRRPMRMPTFVLGTVMILSTMRLEETASPFLVLGEIGNLNNGAAVGLLVNGQIVMDSVPLKLSSCRITTGRGLPA
jgi:hypothetical protein